MARSHAVCLGLLLRAIVVICEPAPPRPDFFYGYVESLEHFGDTHHFKLRYEGSSHEVIYTGSMPDTVCAGEDTMLEGFLDGDLLMATSVHGPGCTMGRECRRWACLPDDKRPDECRLQNKFQ